MNLLQADILNSSLKKWLMRLAQSHGISHNQLRQTIAAGEISNRIESYPIITHVLQSEQVDLDKLATALKNCWALGGKFDAIRLNRFLELDQAAKHEIKRLVSNFPKDDVGAVARIDEFISAATQLGYKTPKDTFDWAGAALLSSVLLTAIEPSRFVDFRQSRWERFISGLNLDIPFEPSDSYGWKLVKCGSFARDVTNTPEFRAGWGSKHGLWILAGISWIGPEPSLSAVVAPDVADPKSYTEGNEKYRLHLAKERSKALVDAAKAKRQSVDPYLHCEVCEFSFIKRYGEIGEGCIEAHHIVPLAKLSEATEVTINDLALVCSNCHRMLHRGDNLFSIADLKGLLS
jgi:hypothetical protein